MNLLKISLIISITGIFLLFFLSNILQQKITNIEDIEDSLLNKKITVKGEIFNIRTYEESNFQVISIKDKTGKIDITCPLVNVTLNQEIIVTGIVKEYREYLQIQAEKIISSSP